MSIESVMLFNHLILSHSLLILSSIFHSIRALSNDLHYYHQILSINKDLEQVIFPQVPCLADGGDFGPHCHLFAFSCHNTQAVGLLVCMCVTGITSVAVMTPCLQQSLPLLVEKNILSLHDSSDPRKLILSTRSALSINIHF